MLVRELVRLDLNFLSDCACNNLATNEGPKMMTAVPVTSDDGGIGEILGSKMLIYKTCYFSDECWIKDNDSHTSNQ